MTEFKLELPKEIPVDNRAELLRTLEKSAQVQNNATHKKDFDAAQTLFMISATVQTVDIVWHWFQALRAKHANKKLDVVITTPKGKKMHLQKVTLEELRKLLG